VRTGIENDKTDVLNAFHKDLERRKRVLVLKNRNTPF
jgi:hypothetical protein